MAKKQSITLTSIKQAISLNKEVRLCDGNGLYLHLRGSSSIWEFKYRKKDGKYSFLSIGSYPDFSILDAREKAMALRRQIYDGLDIRLERKKAELKAQAKSENTLEKVANSFLKTQENVITAKTLADKKAKLRMYVYPLLKNVPISDINIKMVRGITDKLANNNKYEILKRTLVILNAILNHAVYLDLIKVNPCLMLSRAYKRPSPVPLACLKPYELPLLLQVFNNANIDRLTYLLFLWQLHTLARPSEAVKMRWDDIDFNKKLWVIPPEKMKMRKAHVVPLTSHMLLILNELMLYNFGNGYVFASGRSKSGHVAKECLIRVISRTELKNKTTAHGFRSLASTILNEQGFDFDLIEKSLAHSDSDKIRSIYNRAEYLEKRRDMLEWWGNLIVKHSQS